MNAMIKPETLSINTIDILINVGCVYNHLDLNDDLTSLEGY